MKKWSLVCLCEDIVGQHWTRTLTFDTDALSRYTSLQASVSLGHGVKEKRLGSRRSRKALEKVELSVAAPNSKYGSNKLVSCLGS